MDYLSVAEARGRPGLKLVLTAGVPGPWGEAAKAVLKAKGLDYLPVRQVMGEDNPELVDWTGHRNAPVLVHDGELPRTGWLDILMLAERLRPAQPLVPEDLSARVEMLGACHLICGERGLGWDRRLMMARDLVPSGPPSEEEPSIVRLLRSYGYTPAEGAAAADRVAGLLRHLAGRLHDQEKKGSSYFVGDGLTALDLYWACFSALLDPLPAEVNPMPDAVRDLYRPKDAVVREAIDPILIRHRDMVYQRHIGLPLDY